MDLRFQYMVMYYLNLKREFVLKLLIADVNQAIIGAGFLAHYDLLVDLKNKYLPFDSFEYKLPHRRNS